RGDFQVAIDLQAPDWAKTLLLKGFYPFAPTFVWYIKGRFFMIYHFLFPLMNAGLYRWFGYPGFYLIPLVSLWLFWIVFIRACHAANFSDNQTALALGCLIYSSPVTLYSAMFWEHTV